MTQGVRVGLLVLFLGIAGLIAIPLLSPRPSSPPGGAGNRVGWMMPGRTGNMMPYYNQQGGGGVSPGTQSPAGWGPMMQGTGPGYPPGGAPSGPVQYRSNAERTYYTATSAANRPILGSLGTMHMSYGLSCTHCHGASGRGGTVNVLMGVANVPPITWSALSRVRSKGTFGSRPAYDDARARRAIRQGAGAAGHPLRAPMPRWDMTEAQAGEMVSYLRTLK